MVRDPVCGMNVDEPTAATTEYQGKIYYFCAVGCKKALEKEPHKYVRAPPETSGYGNQH